MEKEIIKLSEKVSKAVDEYLCWESGYCGEEESEDFKGVELEEVDRIEAMLAGMFGVIEVFGCEEKVLEKLTKERREAVHELLRL